MVKHLSNIYCLAAEIVLIINFFVPILEYNGARCSLYSFLFGLCEDPTIFRVGAIIWFYPFFIVLAVLLISYRKPFTSYYRRLKIQYYFINIALLVSALSGLVIIVSRSNILSDVKEINYSTFLILMCVQLYFIYLARRTLRKQIKVIKDSERIT